MCKGAESAMLDRAVNGDSVTTLQHINEYAMVRSCKFHPFSMPMWAEESLCCNANRHQHHIDGWNDG